MAESNSYPLSSIFRSLSLILHDRLLAKQGRRIDLYFDTTDLIAGLVGFRQYVDLDVRPPRLKSQFYWPRALVDCLYASGWLGTCFLLPPHQAEFLRLIEDGKVFHRGGRRDEQIDEFLKLLDFSSSPQRHSIRGTTGEELYRFIREQAGNSDKAFKAVQCILYRPEERLGIWQERQMLRPCPYEFDYVRLTKSSRFKILLENFEDARPGHYYNNFADAVSLAMLADLTERAISDPSVSLPRFFDTGGLFQKVSNESGLEPILQPVMPDGSRFTVLIDANYLIYKATFDSPLRQSRQGSPVLSGYLVAPEELHKRLEQIVGSSESFSLDPQILSDRVIDLDAIDQSDIEGKPLSEVIKELADVSFLKNIWLEEIAERELADFAERFNAEDIDSEEFRQGVSRVLVQARRTFEEKAGDFERLNMLWHELKDGILQLRVNFATTKSPPQEIIRDQLLRFSLPEMVKSQIDEVLGKLLDKRLAETDITASGQWPTLVEAYFEASRPGAVNLNKAQFAAAVLWAMKSYKNIIGILRNVIGRPDNLSVDLLFAGACFRARLESRRGEEILRRLVDRMSDLQRNFGKLTPIQLKQLADHAIGVGYLQFHLWHSRNYAVEWREGTNGGKRPMDEDGEKLLRGAADSAHKAVRAILRLETIAPDLEKETEKKRVYAINQVLYYLTELGDSGLMEEMSNAAAELPMYKDSAQDLWQPTFHDTLARYHHFLSVRSRKRNLQTAYEEIQEAVRQSWLGKEGAPWDDLVNQYYPVVLAAKDRLEEIIHQEARHG